MSNENKAAHAAPAAQAVDARALLSEVANLLDSGIFQNPGHNDRADSLLKKIREALAASPAPVAAHADDDPDWMGKIPHAFKNDGREPDWAAYAAAEAHAQQDAAPVGYKLVPLEPTPEMQQAGHDTPGAHMYNASYRAMVAAAPGKAAAATAGGRPCSYVESGDRREEYEVCVVCGDTRHGGNRTKCGSAIKHLEKVGVLAASAANAGGLPVAAAISYWEGSTDFGVPLEGGISPRGWSSYRPTTLEHGKAIAERGDKDKRVKWLFDRATATSAADAKDATREAIQRACRDLPWNYEVSIELERESGCVLWRERGGSWHAVEGEGFISDDIIEAIDAAIAASQKGGA